MTKERFIAEIIRMFGYSRTKENALDSIENMNAILREEGEEAVEIDWREVYRSPKCRMHQVRV